ncbi:MAG: DUF885 domain-containing protein [Clostridiales bacterium]|nr:DUF885 domain-containing protein [Clostridiales bacterium]
MKRYVKKIPLVCALAAAAIVIPAAQCAFTGTGHRTISGAFAKLPGFHVSYHTDTPDTENLSDVPDSTADQTFTDYTYDLFREEVAASPLTLHYTLENPENYGITSYNSSLGIYSAENTVISAALAESVLSVLQEFAADTLSVENRITRDILSDSLETAITAAGFPYYDEPLSPSTGIQSELPILLAEFTFEDEQDICDYLDIISSVPEYFDSICAYEKEKYSQGLFMSSFTAETIIAQCEDFAAAAEDNYLIYTFEEKTEALTDLTAEEQAAYIEKNNSAILREVLPAFQEIADTLETLISANEVNEAASNTAETIAEDDFSNISSSEYKNAGLCRFPLGNDYYAYLVKQATGSSDNIQTLKNRVESQRASDLLRISSLLSKNPSLETETASVGAPGKTPEEMLAILEEAISADFPCVDNCAYTVKYADSTMEVYLAPAFYLTSPLDGYAQNSIYINSSNGYEGIRLFTTLAHEGYPGHLYQNAYFCGTNPAPLRALLGPVGYSEGWATYAELFSYRYAGCSEEVSELLALEQSVILSLYATADFGIHADGWSFADTLDFFSDYGFSDEETIREIYELIAAEPAHYLKYYIGYLEFLDLKEYAAELCGMDYTDYAFHQAVLTIGPAPFSILRKYLPEYLKNS